MKSLFLALSILTSTLFLMPSSSIADGMPQLQSPMPPPPPSTQNSLFGSWTTVNATFINNAWITTQFKFTPYEMEVRAVCQYQNYPSISVTTIVPVHYFDNQIFIDGNGSASSGNGYYGCTVTVNRARLEYYYKNSYMDEIVIFDPYNHNNRYDLRKTGY